MASLIPSFSLGGFFSRWITRRNTADKVRALSVKIDEIQRFISMNPTNSQELERKELARRIVSLAATTQGGSLADRTHLIAAHVLGWRNDRALLSGCLGEAILAQTPASAPARSIAPVSVPPSVRPTAPTPDPDPALEATSLKRKITALMKIKIENKLYELLCPLFGNSDKTPVTNEQLAWLLETKKNRQVLHRALLMSNHPKTDDEDATAYEARLDRLLKDPETEISENADEILYVLSLLDSVSDPLKLQEIKRGLLRVDYPKTGSEDATTYEARLDRLLEDPTTEISNYTAEILELLFDPSEDLEVPALQQILVELRNKLFQPIPEEPIAPDVWMRNNTDSRGQYDAERYATVQEDAKTYPQRLEAISQFNKLLEQRIKRAEIELKTIGSSGS